jgi:hypothetical protein
VLLTCFTSIGFGFGFEFKGCSAKERYIVLKHSHAVRLTTDQSQWIWMSEKEWPSDIHRSPRSINLPNSPNNREYRRVRIPSTYNRVWYPEDYTTQIMFIARNNDSLPEFMFSYEFDYARYEYRLEKLTSQDAKRLMNNIEERRRKEQTPTNMDLYEKSRDQYWGTMRAANGLARAQSYVDKAHMEMINAYNALTEKEKSKVSSLPKKSIMTRMGIW